MKFQFWIAGLKSIFSFNYEKFDRLSNNMSKKQFNFEMQSRIILWNFFSGMVRDGNREILNWLRQIVNELKIVKLCSAIFTIYLTAWLRVFSHPV